MSKPDNLTPGLLRQFLGGLLDRTTLPRNLLAQLDAIQRRIVRQGRRREKREQKATAYARNGLNGTRAVARRQRQIAAGQLQVSA